MGHGSGKLLPGVDPDALKAYGSTIEEARADLFGLYYLADPKRVELGLTPSADAYKAVSYTHLDVYKRQEYEESSSGDGQYDAFVRALRKIYKVTLGY